MTLDKYLELPKKIFNNYSKLLLYIFFILVILFVLYFTYVNVYKTSIAPSKIKDSEIIAKKQKVDITLFKEIEEDIKTKSDESIEKIPNIFQ